ncbi:spondin domain-containing protein [uncultured Paraglaciecola sp.]|uniref:spondin domain-containing protein n=1 Tax=uncultured Paraglaciecola sp. TaxID=1765024 RepID=UPI002608372E|nr:spondin domain-containing protein [uncultured Paraglaciecola sp.]
MFTSIKTKKLQISAALLLALGLSACGEDEVEVIREVEVIVEVPAEIPDPVDYSYEVTVTNLTNSQPLSPVAVVLHASGKLWTIGGVPSVELEKIAEGGDNSGLLNLGMASASGMGIIGPGGNETVSVTIQDVMDAKLTVATMLVNTNDAFSGLNAFDLSQLAVGESWSENVGVYDSGSEVNSEAVGTMPGPADGGEGFNAMRNDTGYVSMHPGLVTNDDGLNASVLTVEHKFDNPAVRIKVTRTE